ncbi:Major Facilitator Superfamily protein [Corynebacterium mycetoides]|uniref:Major Facilitator Superfamily protein n=1 Tax=Corynebacterium mycetoides TaxID=38302 RepID=A0A1G9L6H5_9CORY|nr:MFS transporter [Corynebacterium mycetoides]SDL57343.1 Major Facilitator Superfamily protein [Corynebacterium mycetoides]
MSTRKVFASVLFFLITAGWGANHFASVLVALKERAGMDALLANSAYGIYAAGLFPCLIAGGFLADRFGGRPVVITGSLVAALGNAVLMLTHTPFPLLAGRFVVGLGVGLVVSAGTAWAARLAGASGATLAGIFLTSGFALGPIFSGIIASVVPYIWVPYAVTIVLSLVAVAVSLVVGDVPNTRPLEASSAPPQDPAPVPAHERSAAKALATSVPVALWVFASITTTVVGLSARVAHYFPTGVFVPGIAAGLGFGTALILQALGRRFDWGPLSGVVGALASAAGMLIVGLAGPQPTFAVFIVAALLLGTAYGLCLRDGLLDVDTYSPPAHRGRVIGIYYVATYIGFALPPFIQWLEPRVGPTLPFFALSALALTSAVVRFVQIRSGYLSRS